MISQADREDVLLNLWLRSTFFSCGGKRIAITLNKNRGHVKWRSFYQRLLFITTQGFVFVSKHICLQQFRLLSRMAFLTLRRIVLASLLSFGKVCSLQNMMILIARFPNCTNSSDNFVGALKSHASATH